jgi:hypothetical protein
MTSAALLSENQDGYHISSSPALNVVISPGEIPNQKNLSVCDIID